MWMNDLMWWTMVGIALYLAVRVVFDARDSWLRAEGGDIRKGTEAWTEGLISSHHLQPDHYYLFVWDMRCISQAMGMKISRMLSEKGIDNAFVRHRPGNPPIVYDLKRPEVPVKGI